MAVGAGGFRSCLRGELDGRRVTRVSTRTRLRTEVLVSLRGAVRRTLSSCVGGGEINFGRLIHELRADPSCVRGLEDNGTGVALTGVTRLLTLLNGRPDRFFGT